MRSLRVCLCTVLLSVSVQGYNWSFNGWSMSGADVVSAVEGVSAVLPCTFTHPPLDLVPSGSVIWFREKPGARKPVFRCSYPGSGRSGCDTTLKTGGGWFGFVGNLSRRDASIMVQRLNRSDGGRYQCRVELNIDKFETAVLTNLSVRAPGESVSVMTGTEGASATLPCEFTRPPQSLTAHTVTWMRKDPYRHIVTFRRYENGSWEAENGVTRYELVRDPERGNVLIRIKQLSVEDSHRYLCLAEFRKMNHDYSSYRGQVTPPFIHVFQSEIQLQVRPGTGAFAELMLCIPLGLKTLALLVMGTVLYGDKLRKRRD
ncbi:sialic acid-binding Ig-like lectin 15 [Mobula hypostoma]|uniref:sialic acid-binding Ig-like lectin 15 n=1 Tax=Mobula hypostoma TaxID=723540 RepID=UPI002FC386E2